ncbi:hypothetical protein R1flu_009334 [Riccia fluitans]|uniref:Uncharacterized protein n=1 Tax=Riccia fluitans TaxID=41844 RepID=A0ABD1Z5X8_9MARC
MPIQMIYYDLQGAYAYGAAAWGSVIPLNFEGSTSLTGTHGITFMGDEKRERYREISHVHSVEGEYAGRMEKEMVCGFERDVE